AELEKLEGRQGSAGARPGATPEPGLPIGLSHGKLKSLLARALEPETEEEGASRSGASSMQEDLAFDRTMSSADDAHLLPKTLDVQTALGVRTQLSAPTRISGPLSSAAGELPPSVMSVSK